MAGCIEMSWQRRRATYKPTFDRPKIGLKKDDEVKCRVLGLFQYTDGDSEACPYFIIELAEGKCTYADPEHIQFADADEEEGDEWLSCT